MFVKDYPQATPLMLYRGKRRYKEDQVLCLPVEEFIKKLHPDAPIQKII